MAGRFVRSSKYRHVFGRSTKKEQCYDNLRISRNAWDTNLVKANPEYIAVNWEASGGGAFAVIPTGERGRLPERIPLFRGHTAVVLDTDWNPFNDSLICSSSDDGKVFLWRVPENFSLHSDLPVDEIKDIAPVGKLSGHPKKVGHVLFNPAAENVLASASGDFTVKLWDIEAGAAKLSLKTGDIVQSLSWSPDGAMLVTTSRDKKLRLWDTRQQKAAYEGPGHAGAKNSRAVWMGEHGRIATTGFSRMSDRQLALWDIRAPREPLGGFQMLDSISGVCMPFWDDGSQCLYLAGKGDGNIRYYEYENDKFEYLSEYKSADPQRGIAFVPKRGVNMHDNEVTRAYKTVNDSYIEPISFIVPRRSETFQEDIYPPTVGLRPAMSSKEWLGGKTALPPKVDMEALYDGSGMKEISEISEPSTQEPEPEQAPVKGAEPPTKKTEPEPVREEPTPQALRSPPPSMKEQGGSMMALADKYADNDVEREDASDESSFEEVQRPVERAAVVPAPQDIPTKTIKDATAASTTTAKTPAVEQEPARSSSKVGTSGVSTASPKDSESTPTRPSEVGLEGLEREVRNIKSLMAQQNRQLATQAETMAILLQEVKALRADRG